MQIVDNIKSAAVALFQKAPAPIAYKKKQLQAEYYSGNQFSVSFNGEKSLGEIGPALSYTLDYNMLRTRSYQSYIDSEITQTVIGRFCTWIVGDGLKLNCQPEKMILSKTFKTENFNDIVESRFQLWAGSKYSSYNGMQSLHALAKSVYKNAIIGGDVLFVLRYEDGLPNVQIIDGAHVQSPLYGSDSLPGKSVRGNDIRHGVEIDARGKHVGYYVQKKGLSFEYDYIPAYSAATGLRVASLVSVLDYRIDNTRGVPLIVTVLETLKKMERYKEATVGSAEERQKIAYSVEHTQFSDGRNPLQSVLQKAIDAGGGDIPVNDDGKQVADNIAVTTKKQAFNMPIGASLKLLESKNELYFAEFYTTNIHLICACIGIPMEVAMSKYDSNFSSARAALKDWEHTINVKRAEFVEQFYSIVYNFWLHVNILDGNILANGYMLAYGRKDFMTVEAYRRCRFIGANVPHIDPVKEVTAERLKLGLSGGAIPLTTIEAATEALNGGDSDHNIAQFALEYKAAESAGIPLTVENNSNNDPAKQ